MPRAGWVVMANVGAVVLFVTVVNEVKFNVLAAPSSAKLSELFAAVTVTTAVGFTFTDNVAAALATPSVIE